MYLLGDALRYIKSGKVRNLETIDREIILNKNLSMADKALRVIACAYLDTESLPSKIDTDTVENGLIFVRISSE